VFQRLRRQEKGRPILASTINQVVDGASWLSRLAVGPGLGMLSTSAGPAIYDARPRPLWVQLSGSTSPYSFAQVYGDGAGGFATLTGGITGTAYEFNGAAGLGGIVVQVERWGGADWYSFYMPRGVADSTCSGTTRICATITSDGCTGTTAYGATVTVKDNTGATVGTCTVDGKVTSLLSVAGGSGYTNGTGYAIGFSGGGGTGAAGTFDVIGGAVVNLNLTAAGTGYTSAPTLSFPGAGAGSGAIGTASMGATCCVSVPSSGTYTVSASIPGATAISTTVHARCNVDNAVSLAFSTNALGTACINFNHCGTANGGDSIAISKAGSAVATATTDGTGSVCLRLGTGSYTYVLTTPLGSTKSGSFSVTACTTTNVSAGGSVSTFCLRARTDAPSGCTASITLKNQDTGATLGSGSLTTTTVSVGLIQGDLCFSIPEFIQGTITFFTIVVAFTKWSSTVTNQAALCYPSTSPLFADFRGFGAPC
jgi:hypothetical protein